MLSDIQSSMLKERSSRGPSMLTFPRHALRTMHVSTTCSAAFLPGLPELDEPGWTSDDFIRDFPVDFTLVLENVADPDHGVFAHQTTIFDSFAASAEYPMQVSTEPGKGGPKVSALLCVSVHPFPKCEAWASPLQSLHVDVFRACLLLGSVAHRSVFQADPFLAACRHFGSGCAEQNIAQHPAAFAFPISKQHPYTGSDEALA